MFISFITSLIIAANILAGLFITDNQSTYTILKKPELKEVRAIYLTGYTAGWKERRNELISAVDNTELNAVVIDIKDATGRIFFDTDLPMVNEIGSEDIRIPDLEEWLKELREKGIYTIARIVVFQDPFLARAMPEIALVTQSGGLWRDYKGQAWVDPTYKLIWDYNLDLAKEATRIGFDEVNFDYVRFPSDGNIKEIVYANLDNNNQKEEKNVVMKEFYEYVNDTLKFEPIVTSADLFGMTLLRSDGMNIGQRLEDAAPNFDFIGPMVYPSHYPPGHQGFANPAEHPYEVIYHSLISGKSIIEEAGRAKLRPWIQDFDLGAVYTPAMIRAQIQASIDGGGSGYFVWNASNNYTIAGFVKE